MGNKRLKLARGLGDFTPMSVNFSQLEQEMEDGEVAFEPSDLGLETARMQDNIAYEQMIIGILTNLEPREQLVFVFQLLRDGGYQIDHASFAKTLHVSRRQYMRVVEDVRTKTLLFLMAYRHKNNQPSHKEG